MWCSLNCYTPLRFKRDILHGKIVFYLFLYTVLYNNMIPYKTMSCKWRAVMNFHWMNLQLVLVSVDCNNFYISQIMTMFRPCCIDIYVVKVNVIKYRFSYFFKPQRDSSPRYVSYTLPHVVLFWLRPHWLSSKYLLLCSENKKYRFGKTWEQHFYFWVDNPWQQVFQYSFS